MTGVPEDQDYERIRGFDSIEDPGPGRERQLKKIKVRGIYHQICQDIYALPVVYSAIALAVLPPLVRMFGMGAGRSVGDMDLPGAYLSCYKLPMRSGHQYPIKFLRGESAAQAMQAYL